MSNVNFFASVPAFNYVVGGRREMQQRGQNGDQSFREYDGARTRYGNGDNSIISVDAYLNRSLVESKDLAQSDNILNQSQKSLMGDKQLTHSDSSWTDEAKNSDEFKRTSSTDNIINNESKKHIFSIRNANQSFNKINDSKISNNINNQTEKSVINTKTTINEINTTKIKTVSEFDDNMIIEDLSDNNYWEKVLCTCSRFCVMVTAMIAIAFILIAGIILFFILYYVVFPSK